MTRKQIIEMTCDDCGCKTDNTLTNNWLNVDGYDLCDSCIKVRVKHSIKMVAPDRQCGHCGGHGKVKDFYGHNDYHWINCPSCGGRGLVDL